MSICLLAVVVSVPFALGAVCSDVKCVNVATEGTATGSTCTGSSYTYGFVDSQIDGYGSDGEKTGADGMVSTCQDVFGSSSQPAKWKVNVDDTDIFRAFAAVNELNTHSNKIIWLGMKISRYVDEDDFDVEYFDGTASSIGVAVDDYPSLFGDNIWRNNYPDTTRPVILRKWSNHQMRQKGDTKTYRVLCTLHGTIDTDLCPAMVPPLGDIEHKNNGYSEFEKGYEKGFKAGNYQWYGLYFAGILALLLIYWTISTKCGVKTKAANSKYSEVNQYSSGFDSEVNQNLK